MNDELCLEKHKRIDEKQKEHDDRLNGHDHRLDKLEQYKSKTEEKFDSLCTQIKQLVSIMKWFIVTIIGALGSFFFYAIQHSIFK